MNHPTSANTERAEEDPQPLDDKAWMRLASTADEQASQERVLAMRSATDVLSAERIAIAQEVVIARILEQWPNAASDRVQAHVADAFARPLVTPPPPGPGRPGFWANWFENRAISGISWFLLPWASPWLDAADLRAAGLLTASLVVLGIVQSVPPVIVMRRGHWGRVRMAAVEPRVEAFQKAHPEGDEASQHTMGLYKTYGVSPFGACLPLMFVPTTILCMWLFLWLASPLLQGIAVTGPLGAAGSLGIFSGVSFGIHLLGKSVRYAARRVNAARRAISLSKGGNVSLTKSAPGLTNILIGLGWYARATDGEDFDLDASGFMVSAGGKVRSDSDFIFFNQPSSADGSVKHLGDNTTGEGDDEQITVDLTKVPADVDKIAIAVTIHDAELRKQSLGMVSEAYVRIVNASDNAEIVRYDLSEDFSNETALIFGEIYRNNGEWNFRAVGQGFQGGLAAMAQNFGVNI
jgi:tellurium resistance protein TerD